MFSNIIVFASSRSSSLYLLLISNSKYLINKNNNKDYSITFMRLEQLEKIFQTKICVVTWIWIWISSSNFSTKYFFNSGTKMNKKKKVSQAHATYAYLTKFFIFLVLFFFSFRNKQLKFLVFIKVFFLFFFTKFQLIKTKSSYRKLLKGWFPMFILHFIQRKSLHVQKKFSFISFLLSLF